MRMCLFCIMMQAPGSERMVAQVQMQGFLGALIKASSGLVKNIVKDVARDGLGQLVGGLATTLKSVDDEVRTASVISAVKWRLSVP